MFAEFGPAPLCLELDFDSFDGPSHWVARFRRMSGWMLVAKAIIQSEHDIVTAKLVAACDEQENPIPAFKALNLLHCDWINPTYCDELPPDILDDLICEQEGELVRRWHREKNVGLAEAFEAQEQRIAELEGGVRSAVRQNEHRVAELRQRRRHPDATPEMRAAMAAIIADLIEENDALVAEMTLTRETIRLEAEAFEEALWSRDELLIEVEPLHLLRWTAQRSSRADVPPQRRQYCTLYLPESGGAPGKPGSGAEDREQVDAMLKDLAQEKPSKTSSDGWQPRGLCANPILLRDLEAKSARLERMLGQPGLPRLKANYLRSRLAECRQRIGRLTTRNE